MLLLLSNTVQLIDVFLFMFYNLLYLYYKCYLSDIHFRRTTVYDNSLGWVPNGSFESTG